MPHYPCGNGMHEIGPVHQENTQRSELKGIEPANSGISRYLQVHAGVHRQRVNPGASRRPVHQPLLRCRAHLRLPRPQLARQHHPLQRHTPGSLARTRHRSIKLSGPHHFAGLCCSLLLYQVFSRFTHPPFVDLVSKHFKHFSVLRGSLSAQHFGPYLEPSMGYIVKEI